MKETISDKIESKSTKEKENSDLNVGHKSIFSKAKHGLVKALKIGEAKNKETTQINPLVRKVAANETLTDSEKEFILSLPDEDLNKFIELLRKKLMKLVDGIHESGRMDAETLNQDEVDGFLAINDMYDFIREHRKGVKVYRYIFGPKYQIGKYWTISGEHGLFYEDDEDEDDGDNKKR